MKLIFSLLLAVVFNAAFSQKLFFSTSLTPANIRSEELVPSGLEQNYSSTLYFRETAFLPDDRFFMKLSANQTIEVIYEKWFNYSNGAISYSGKIKNDPNSSVVLSKYENRWHGMITDGQLQKYIVQQTGTDVFAVSKIEELTFIQQDKKDDYIIDYQTQQPTANYNVCDATNPCTVSGVVISIMVVYTPAAATAYGSVANTVSSITTAITNMNVANTNSGVNSNISFNLVHTEQVVYTESGSTSTDLGRLRTDGDGIMDNVHTLRTNYLADLVALVVASPTNTCGVGYLNTNATNYSANNGFNVTVFNCVVGNFSMAHELGHNMGLHHDWHVSSSTTPCSHHHGYVNQTAIPTGLPTTARWRTILAYNDQCSAQSPTFNCTRVNNWSNPNILRNGDPMGINIGQTNPAYEVYGINRFACVVAAFLGANVLPLQLKNTSVNYVNNQLTVKWQTENELGVKSFEIETASQLPTQFNSRKIISARNNTINSYSEVVQMHETGNFYVRLKYTDADGKIKYSDVFLIRGEKNNNPRLQNNLINNQLTILLYTEKTNAYNFQIFSADGRLLKAGIIIPQLGHSVNNIKSDFLTKGQYFIKIEKNGEVNTLKFQKM